MDPRTFINTAKPEMLTELGDAWIAIGADFEELFAQYVDAVTKVNGTHWEGRCADTAQARALADQKTMQTLADKLDALGQRAKQGYDEINAPLRRARGALTEAQNRRYLIGRTLSLTHPDANPSAEESQKLLDLQAELNDAVRTTMQADIAVRNDLNAARADLRASFISAAALGGDQANSDGKQLADDPSKLSPEAVQRITEAGHLTPDQIAALQRGDTTTIPASQMEYLNQISRSLDSKSTTEIQQIMNKLPPDAQKALANSFQIISNPSVNAGPVAADDKQLPNSGKGGLSQIPKSMQNVLTNHYDVSQGKPAPNIGGLGLSKVTEMISQADMGSMPGSEINKSLLQRAAEIAPQVDSHTLISTDHRDGSADGLVQRMVEVAGQDKGAVHDILHGDGLEPGNTTNKVLDPLMRHHWNDDGTAVGKMLSWIETDATSPDHNTSMRAGEAASGLAEYIAKGPADLLHVDGGKSHSLGDINPHAVQGISSALSPYIANLAGVDGDKYLNTPGFKAPDDVNDVYREGAQKIFAVIDSDKDAAIQFNARALDTAGQLQALWTQSVLSDPDNSENGLATGSGIILGLVDKGIETEIGARGVTGVGDAIHEFADKGAAYDGFKGAVTSGVKMIPVVKDLFGPVIDMSNSYAKMNLIGMSYNPPAIGSSHVDNSHEFFPARQFYQVAQVIQAQNGFLPHDPRYSNLFESDGNLKDYQHSVGAAGNAVELHSDLMNILKTYKGGALKDELQNMSTLVLQGRDGVR
ncbi:TPR repeat region-containing protein [Nocardia anaemiae]|uniref:TPR repeat region-containing protein n=1 Tax=Nocardia anaemiae TaxID=263910 RepID=UPI0007A5561F|nr:hypothetical protein [Nocardia anaemiae]